MKRWILGIVVIFSGLVFIIGIRLGSKSTVPSINPKNKPLKEGIIPHEALKAKIEVKQEEKVLNVKDWIDPREIEVTPDGITLAEVEEHLKQQKKINQREVEVTPGVTLAEVEENLKNAQKEEKYLRNIEIAPGVTVADIEENLKRQEEYEREINPRDIEITPGVTLAEVEENLKGAENQENQIDLSNIEVAPGLTAAEVEENLKQQER